MSGRKKLPMTSGNTHSTSGNTTNTSSRMSFRNDKSRPKTVALANKQAILRLVRSSSYEVNEKGVVINLKPNEQKGIILEPKVVNGIKKKETSIAEKRNIVPTIEHGVIEGGMQLVKRLPPIPRPPCVPQCGFSTNKDSSVSTTKDQMTKSSSSVGPSFQGSSSMSSFGSGAGTSVSSWRKNMFLDTQLQTSNTAAAARFARANGITFSRRRTNLNESHLMLMSDLMINQGHSRENLPQEIVIDPFENGNSAHSLCNSPTFSQKDIKKTSSRSTAQSDLQENESKRAGSVLKRTESLARRNLQSNSLRCGESKGSDTSRSKCTSSQSNYQSNLISKDTWSPCSLSWSDSSHLSVSEASSQSEAFPASTQRNINSENASRESVKDNDENMTYLTGHESKNTELCNRFNAGLFNHSAGHFFPTSKKSPRSLLRERNNNNQKQECEAARKMRNLHRDKRAELMTGGLTVMTDE